MDLPKRKRNRLLYHGYNQLGAYFITICVKEHSQLLWASNLVDKDNMLEGCYHLSPAGKIVEEAIQNISKAYKDRVVVDKYVIMPNHIHLILSLIEDGDGMSSVSISKIIQQFKGMVTKNIGNSIWQKSFYDHVIRGEKDYKRIWEYIDENPIKWQEDEYYNG